MDVFRLLSRSAKPVQETSQQHLPSSGEASNPQLFGQHEESPPTANSSKKRKRGINGGVQAAVLPAELNFFGNAHNTGDENGEERKKGLSRKDIRNERNGARTKAGENDDETMLDTPERMSVVNCKKVLRNHKLKVIILEEFSAQEQGTPVIEKAKKKKRRKEEKTIPIKKAKNDQTQLYPEPLATFAELRSKYGVFRRLTENLEAQGYTVPTEVQLGGLPLLLGSLESHARGDRDETISTKPRKATSGQGIDLLTIAPTGSGKTIAFLVPVLNALIEENKLQHESQDSAELGPRAIVIAPTKELASQIVNEARKLSIGTGVKTALMKKGMEVVQKLDVEREVDVESEEDQSEEDTGEIGSDNAKSSPKPSRKRRRAVITKAAIIVATPLSLLNALKKQDGSIALLPSVKYLVLDEADVLLDPLFREQTLSLWKSCTNPLLRISLWSATMGSNVEELARKTIDDRWESLFSTEASQSPARLPLVRLVVGLKDTAIPNVAHKLIYAATEQGKLLALRQLLHPTATPSADTTPSLRPPFLVFTQTIPRAVALHAELLYDIPPEAGGSSRIAVLHADLPSTARDSTMARFRRGEVWILITTDLLARGVDFRGLNGVVNYDVPNSAAAYVHRVGRTGRAGREGGVAVTLYTKEDVPYVRNVANVIRASEKLRGKDRDNEGEVKQWLLDALPTPSQRDRQRLKKRGIESRRPAVAGQEGKEKTRARISTKSGWERKMENNRRGAVSGSQRRKDAEDEALALVGDGGAEKSDFEGFED
ncbi:P-loop containing nucleoside triphosphate hydrolase protein [Mytilinidion resinicola]|uniref:ATP-dependent RNA helicase ROK1 n=1 Tax=Mytilinidion resinicola TaxID=574789 RepID=A0A6A6YH80_9PEZI|nr:P-loop containing nucleoside triphosphate hydrolase protein [Mytilinidion resinicola]KAF2808161.1 P-loop containing nucleoside triphosphate hydrolase protein [Mytilinidion resinicola]